MQPRVLVRAASAHPFGAALQTVFGFIRTAVLRAGKLIVAVAEVIAEARMQRTRLEAEMYFGRYHRWPENDDRSVERAS